MTDLVEIIEGHCETLDWSFTYGNKANQNLLESDLVVDKIYLLLDPVTRVKEKTEFGGTASITFNGDFLLLVKSDLDDIYSNKYEDNIKPLLVNSLQLLEDVIDCSDYEILTWTIRDTINVNDFNGDGVIVTYSIKIS